MTESHEHPPIDFDAGEPPAELDSIDFSQLLDGEDCPISEEDLNEVMHDVSEMMQSEKDNPLANQSVNQLIKTYLDATPRGIRWLALQANVSRKKVQLFLDGEKELDQDAIGRLIDVVLTYHQKEADRVQKRDAKSA